MACERCSGSGQVCYACEVEDFEYCDPEPCPKCRGGGMAMAESLGPSGGDLVEIDPDEVFESSNTPHFECQSGDGNRTEFMVEFRDLATDEVSLRSLCRECVKDILEDI